MKLNDAIETLADTYQSLDLVARGLEVNAAEVDTALKAAKAGTVEHLALQYLAKYNPYTPPKVKTE